MSWLRASLRSVCVTLVFACALAGCDLQSTPPEEPQVGGPYGDIGGDDTTHLSGRVWDPEAYWIDFAYCGDPCPLPPLVAPGFVLYERSVVAGATVSLFDPLTNRLAKSSRPTTETGIWEIHGVPSRPGVPFFALGTHDPAALGGKPALSNGNNTTLPPMVPGAYVPTFSMRPISTQWTQCLGQVSELLSDTGILEAVAKHRSLSGTPVTVADLQNPQKFGGVVVWWMYLPADAAVRVPAFGTEMQANVGEVLPIAWAPPGVLPAAIQSRRGFFVKTDMKSSPIGLTAIVLPPATGFTTEVQFRAVDPVTDAAQKRPWTFPALPPVPVAPGISFGQLPGLLIGAPAPPNWVCLL